MSGADTNLINELQIMTLCYETERSKRIDLTKELLAAESRLVTLRRDRSTLVNQVLDLEDVVSELKLKIKLEGGK